MLMLGVFMAMISQNEVRLRCVGIDVSVANQAVACKEMSDALSSVDEINGVKISNDTDTDYTFVFTEISNSEVAGSLFMNGQDVDVSYSDWQVSTNVMDATDITVGYKGLAKALLKVNEIIK